MQELVFDLGVKITGPHFEETPLNPTGGFGSTVSSPSEVWGGAAAEIEFGAFQP